MICPGPSCAVGQNAEASALHSRFLVELFVAGVADVGLETRHEVSVRPHTASAS